MTQQPQRTRCLEVIPTHRIGTKRLEIAGPMTPAEVYETSKEVGAVFILESIGWSDGQATMRFVPGNGVGIIVDGEEATEEGRGGFSVDSKSDSNQKSRDLQGG